MSVDDHGAMPGEPPACEGRFAPFPDLPEAPAAAVKVEEEDKTLYVAASGTATTGPSSARSTSRRRTGR